MITTVPIQGLNIDVTPYKQPENTYRYAQNAVYESREGDLYALLSEQGTSLVHTLSDNQQMIGHITVTDNSSVVFATDGTSVHTIGLVTDNVYTEILRDTCLNFSLETIYRIKGESRIINGCDRVIYFRDSLNPDRRINLDKIDDGIYLDAAGLFDCTLIELNPDFKIPEIEVNAITSGNLEPGAYQFAIAYLDAEFNVVYRSFITLPVYIIEQVHGGVQLDFKNIDTSYPYINIYALAANTQDGITTEGYCVRKYLPTQNITFSFVLTSITSEDTRVTLDELLQKNIVYDTSRTMEQVQNRLVRANLREKYRDYSSYQSVTNNITTRVVVKQVLATEREQTFIGGEAEAFGIVYIHTDGSESPAFHIPCQTTFAVGAADPAYVHNFTPEAYRPSFTATYVNPRCADSYWGALEGTQVSHFLTPDRDTHLMSGLLAGTTPVTRSIGYEFTVPTYPADVIGHYIVKARKDQSSKRILSKGYAGYTYEHSTGPQDFRGFTYYTSDGTSNITQDRLWFTSPEVLYNNRRVDSDIFEFISSIQFLEERIDAVCTDGNRIEGYGGDCCRQFDGPGVLGVDVDTSISVSYYVSGTNTPVGTPHDVLKTKLFGPLENDILYDDGWKTFNTNQLSPVQLFQSSAGITIPAPNSLIYGAFINPGAVLEDIYSIIYVRTHNNMHVGTTTTFQGDAWVSKFVFNSLLLQEETNGGAFDALTRILSSSVVSMASALGAELATSDSDYYESSQIASTIGQAGGTLAGASGGSSLLIAAGVGASLGATIQSVKELARALKEDAMSDFTKLTTNGSKVQAHLGCCTNFFRTAELQYHGEIFDEFYVESEIDTSLRKKETACSTIYNINDTYYVEYLRDKLMSFDPDAGGGRYVHNTLPCPEVHSYNYDYSKKGFENQYFPLEFTYDYCSECIAEYPSRIAYSTTSPDLNISQGDAYSMYLANAFIEIPAYRGEITRLEYIRNRLLIQTERSSFITQVNPSRLQTNQTTIYVDTGDFLSIEPVELSIADIGHAGNPSGEGVSTPHGFVWLDSGPNAAVFLYNGEQIQDLSQKGLRHFFKERNYAPDYEKINLTYNPITDSLILTHNQYNALIPGFQNRPFTDTDYWQNQSFTISYSFRAQAWVSYHSYLPTYLWYDDNSFLSHKDSGLYRHNNPDSLHTYYGTKYDYIIEYTVPTQHHTIFDTFAYISQVSDDTDTYTPEITFDKLWIYNDTNSSGLQTLESHTPDTIIHNWSNTTKSVIRTDDIYHVSSIRDLSTANKVKSSDWTDTQSSYPIDHVPVNTDPNRYLYLMKNVRGKYFNVRLFFNPEDNYKIVTQMFNTNPRQSHR